MSDVAEQTAEVVAENLEDVIDGVVEVVEVVRNNYVLLGAVLVAGVAGGTGLGYFLAVKKLGKEFDARLEEEITRAKEFYATVNKVDVDGAVLTPMQVLEDRHGVEAAAEALRTYQGEEHEDLSKQITNEGEPYDDVVDERHIRKMEQAQFNSISLDKEVSEAGGEVTVVTEKTETRNVFVDPTFDLEEEMKYRTDEKPYVITHDEYYEAEREYDTASLTYYELDDTLVDEKDKPVEGIDKVVGDDNLVRFGHGSKDKNIVFVRNDRLETDYEIVKSTGSYLEEVLGMPKEEPNSLKHSDQRDRRRAFRRGDE